MSSSPTLRNRALEIPFLPACIPLPLQMQRYGIIFRDNHFLSLKFYSYACAYEIPILTNFSCVNFVYR